MTKPAGPFLAYALAAATAGLITACDQALAPPPTPLFENHTAQAGVELYNSTFSAGASITWPGTDTPQALSLPGAGAYHIRQGEPARAL